MYFLSISVIRNLLFYVKKKPCVLEPFLHLDCRMYSTDWQFLYLKSLMISNIFSHLTLFLRRTMTKFYNERKWVNIRKAVVFNFFRFCIYQFPLSFSHFVARSACLTNCFLSSISFFCANSFFFNEKILNPNLKKISSKNIRWSDHNLYRWTMHKKSHNFLLFLNFTYTLYYWSYNLITVNYKNIFFYWFEWIAHKKFT